VRVNDFALLNDGNGGGRHCTLLHDIGGDVVNARFERGIGGIDGLRTNLKRGQKERGNNDNGGDGSAAIHDGLRKSFRRNSNNRSRRA
jgi:hypothetical protein